MFEQINKQYPEYHFRYLQLGDYHRSVFDTLNQLTNSPKPTQEAFERHVSLMQKSSQKHINIVGIDKKKDQVVAFGTLLICYSLDGPIGKIQNIVTCKSARGKGLGKCIIQILKCEGWTQKCSKISLLCEQKNVGFYDKLGFTREGMIYAYYRK